MLGEADLVHQPLHVAVGRQDEAERAGEALAAGRDR
jgi:hypothetical protein